MLILNEPHSISHHLYIESTILFLGHGMPSWRWYSVGQDLGYSDLFLPIVSQC